MGWRDALRLSGPAFTELSLQAIYAFRQGNILPTGASGDLVPKARRRVWQSKAMVAGLLGFLTLGAAFLLRYSALVTARAFPYYLPPPVFDLGVLTALLGLDVAFLWWTGLQILPTLLSSSVLPVLEALPVDERTLRRVAALVYVRLFDVPVLTVLLLTPLLVSFALGAPAGLAIIPGVVSSVAFALVLSLITARFFVRRVQSSRGGGGSTVLRWTYLVLWVIPAFGMFGFVTLAPAFFTALSHLTATGPSGPFDLLLLAFPFALAALPPVAAMGTGALPLGSGGLAILAGATLGYLGLAAACLAWLGGAVRRVGEPLHGVADGSPSARFGLEVTGPVRSVLVKDLRIASRSPGYAFLILLPILDAFALGLLSYAPGSSTGGADALALGAVTSSALLATFFGPAFFAIEVLAYSYGRTLPLPDRSLVLGKVALVVAILSRLRRGGARARRPAAPCPPRIPGVRPRGAPGRDGSLPHRARPRPPSRLPQGSAGCQPVCRDLDCDPDLAARARRRGVAPGRLLARGREFVDPRPRGDGARGDRRAGSRGPRAPREGWLLSPATLPSRFEPREIRGTMAGGLGESSGVPCARPARGPDPLLPHPAAPERHGHPHPRPHARGHGHGPPQPVSPDAGGADAVASGRRPRRTLDTGRGSARSGEGGGPVRDVAARGGAGGRREVATGARGDHPRPTRGRGLLPRLVPVPGTPWTREASAPPGRSSSSSIGRT